MGNQFTKDDIAYLRAFKVIVDGGKYEIEGKALVQAGALFGWFNGLEKKIEEALKAPLSSLEPGTITPIKEKKGK